MEWITLPSRGCILTVQLFDRDGKFIKGVDFDTVDKFEEILQRWRNTYGKSRALRTSTCRVIDSTGKIIFDHDYYFSHFV
jgi:hypothetical protein